MRKKDPVLRFWDKVGKTGTCWLWTAYRNRDGYGYFSPVHGVRVVAHRYSYQLVWGPLSRSVILDHSCHTPSCVNPEHLRIVTAKQNAENRRMRSTNTLGFVGVHAEPTGRYKATVTHFGRLYSLGTYPTAAKAGEVARKKRLELFTHNDLDRGEEWLQRTPGN